MSDYNISSKIKDKDQIRIKHTVAEVARKSLVDITR